MTLELITKKYLCAQASIEMIYRTECRQLELNFLLNNFFYSKVFENH